MPKPLSPSSLWSAHRAAAGGVSAVSGEELPATLAHARPGVQATHYAMAVYIALVHGQDPDLVEVPSGVSADRALELRQEMAGLV